MSVGPEEEMNASYYAVMFGDGAMFTAVMLFCSWPAFLAYLVFDTAWTHFIAMPFLPQSVRESYEEMKVAVALSSGIALTIAFGLFQLVR